MRDPNIDRIAGTIASFWRAENEGTGSYWNPDGRNDNCVWVCVARSLGLTVPQLSNGVGMVAPPGGATQEQIATFIYAVCQWRRVVPLLDTGGVNGPQKRFQTFVCFKTATGFSHCVIKDGKNYLCFQHSTHGEDLTWVLALKGTRVALAWTFLEKTPRRTRTGTTTGTGARSIMPPPPPRPPKARRRGPENDIWCSAVSRTPRRSTPKTCSGLPQELSSAPWSPIADPN
jgi:hypothetical protein